MRIRLILALIVALVAFTIFACQRTYLVLSNRQPAKMTCQQFIDSGFPAKWVELTDCHLDYLNSVHLQNKRTHEDEGFYIPVHPAADPRAGSVAVLLKMDAADAKSRARRVLTASPIPGFPQETETVKGLVMWGMGSRSELRTALERSSKGNLLRANYVIIDNGAQPNPAEALWGLLLLAGIAGFVFYIIRSRRPTPPPPSLPGIPTRVVIRR